MESEILKVVGQVAGIGGVALGVLLILFRDVIRKAIFPRLTKQQGFRLLVLFLVLVWSVALAGIGAWVIQIVSSPTPTSIPNTIASPIPAISQSTKLELSEEILYRLKQMEKRIEIDKKVIMLAMNEAQSNDGRLLGETIDSVMDATARIAMVAEYSGFGTAVSNDNSVSFDGIGYGVNYAFPDRKAYAHPTLRELNLSQLAHRLALIQSPELPASELQGSLDSLESNIDAFNDIVNSPLRHEIEKTYDSWYHEVERDPQVWYPGYVEFVSSVLDWIAELEEAFVKIRQHELVLPALTY